jgi:hypothetical protein
MVSGFGTTVVEVMPVVRSLLGWEDLPIPALRWVNPLNKLKMEIRRKRHLVFRLRGRLARKIHHTDRGTIDKTNLHDEKEGNRR